MHEKLTDENGQNVGVTIVILTQEIQQNQNGNTQEIKKSKTYDGLEAMKFELTGPYLVFRHNNEEEIHVERIDKLRHAKEETSFFRIPLRRLIIEDSELENITFFGVPKSLYGRIQYFHGEEIIEYEHMIQVVIKNRSIVFHLDEDAKGLAEVSSISNF